MNKKKKKTKKRPEHSTVWWRYRKSKLAMFGLCILIFMVAMAVLVTLFGDYSKAIDLNVIEKYQGPSLAHWFGTDALGRDVFYRVLFGARVSLLWGLAAVAFALLIGAFLGALAGYFGGRVDFFVMRICDIFMSIPVMIMCIAIVAALGTSTINMVIAITITGWTGHCRIIRSAILSIKGQDYIEASRVFGASNGRIIMHHIIPNCLSPIIVQATLSLGSSILAISTMSYLGLGVQPPTPEWGSMMADAQSVIRYYPYLILFPGIATMLTVMGFNLTGDGLRDALDPKLKN